MTNKSTSFIGKSGKFYVQNSKDPGRFAIYDSPASYSEGLQIPQYINAEFARNDFYKYLTVLLKKIALNQQVQSILPALSKKEVIMKAHCKHHKSRLCPATDNLVIAQPIMVKSFDVSSPLEKEECLADRSFD